MDDNNNVIELSNDSQTITFVYNSSGSPIYLEYDGKTYYYEKNLQGDVVGILNTEGEEVVHYDYNAWGEVTGVTGTLADTLGKDNPLRYRGYFYDEETGLYYLQSRYYSADHMRFLSEDDPVLSNDQGEPLGSNLYGYCVNNPVKNSDPTGTFGSPLQWVMAAIGGIVGWHFGDFVAKQLGYSHGWMYWAIRAGITVGGAVIGWFAGMKLTEVAISFLSKNQDVILKLGKKFGHENVYKMLSLLGINQFSLLNTGKFVGYARNLNKVSVSLSVAKAFCKQAIKLGYKVMFDRPHPNKKIYSYHIHLYSTRKKFDDVHIFISEKVYNYLVKLFK